MNLLPPLDQLRPLSAAADAIRRRAHDFVREKGLPTKREEDWRYTSLKTLAEGEFKSSLAHPTAPSHDTLAAVATEVGDWAYNVVFINGVLDRTLSSLEDFPSAVTFSLDVQAGEFKDALEALNVANLGQGLSLTVAAGVRLQKPIRLHFHTSLEGGPALMVHPRIQIGLDREAEATVIESYSGEEGARYFVNAHAEIATGQSARVTYLRVQDDSKEAVHVGRTRWRPSAGSEIVSLVTSLGAKLNRHNLEMTLEGKGVNAKVLGATAGTGDQHADNTTEIDHVVGECTTQQTYKSLLAGQSRSVFTGRIRIRPGAQKADSDQMNNNLLLSSKAEAVSRPQLMIEADDVKATHGSTVGELSDEEIFYLMSRGVARDRAVSLLAAGFLSGLALEIGDEATRKWLIAKLNKTMSAMKTEVP